MAQIMLAELLRRRVFAAPNDIAGVGSGPVPVLAETDGSTQPAPLRRASSFERAESARAEVSIAL